RWIWHRSRLRGLPTIHGQRRTCGSVPGGSTGIRTGRREARGALAGYTRLGMPVPDRYGLTITTNSTDAVERFQHGMDILLSYGPGAGEAFVAAVQADPRLAVAHAGLAMVAVAQGDAAAARASMDKAREVVPGATRRERQHVTAVATLVAGATTRGPRPGAQHRKEVSPDPPPPNQTRRPHPGPAA